MTWPLGARLLEVRTGRRSDDLKFRDILVTKVGRTWATYVDAESPDGPAWKGGRFHLESWRIDGGNMSSPGEVFTDRAAYDRQVKVQAAWADMARRVPYQAPKNMALSNVNQMRRHMGLEPWPSTRDDY
jgi:hypothetical protein